MGMVNLRNYTAQEIDDVLRIKRGSRKVTFKYNLLDRNDILQGTLDGVTSATVSYGTFRVIERSATFGLDEYTQRNINYLTDQIQPIFVLHMPNGGTVEWPLGIFLLESPSRKINGKFSTREIGAYDKTLIIEMDRFTSRYFIPAGTNYVGAVVRILATAGLTKITIPPSPFEIRTDREIPVGTKLKEAVNDLLREINYRSISVDAEGFMWSAPYIEPTLREVTQWYSASRDSIIMPEFEESLDLASRANVFTRVARNLAEETELVATVINSNPMSPISTVNRGRQIVNFDEIENIANQEALEMHVQRIAIDHTSAYSHLTFGTALMPTHGSADTLLCDFPTVFDAPQKFSEMQWEMPLKYDGIMHHKARKVVSLTE